jgi:hypothetical protein
MAAEKHHNSDEVQWERLVGVQLPERILLLLLLL